MCRFPTHHLWCCSACSPDICAWIECVLTREALLRNETKAAKEELEMSYHQHIYHKPSFLSQESPFLPFWKVPKMCLASHACSTLFLHTSLSLEVCESAVESTEQNSQRILMSPSNFTSIHDCENSPVYRRQLATFVSSYFGNESKLYLWIRKCVKD